MKQKIVVFSFLLAAAFILTSSAAFAAYSYNVDSIGIYGNNLPLPGFIFDDFDDGAFNTSVWEEDDPTVSESGSFLNLSSPGYQESMQLGSMNILSEMTHISSTFNLANGFGDFTVESSWDGVAPALNQIYVMSIDTGPGDESITMGFVNWDADLADYFGSPAGPAIFFGRVDPPNEVFDFQSVSIDPDDIEGNVVFNITFEDETDEFLGSYSLNGNTNLNSFAQAVQSGLAGGFVGGDIGVGAEEWTHQPVPIPGAFWMMAAGLALLPVFIRRRK